MSKKNKKQATGQPKEKMVPLRLAQDALNDFAYDAILGNANAHLYLKQILCDFEKGENRCTALELILRLVTCPDSDRRNFYDKYYGDLVAAKFVCAALRIRQLLGMPVGESLNINK